MTDPGSRLGFTRSCNQSEESFIQIIAGCQYVCYDNKHPKSSLEYSKLFFEASQVYIELQLRKERRTILWPVGTYADGCRMMQRSRETSLRRNVR